MLISLIVPIYNSQDYIGELVNSIQQNHYENYELLLIDDGSTDNSLNICEKLAESDKRIKVFHQDNHGRCYSRNVGIKKSQGDVIVFLDNDDWVSPHFLSDVESIYIEHCPDITLFDVLLLNDRNKDYGGDKKQDFKLKIYEKDTIRCFIEETAMPPKGFSNQCGANYGHIWGKAYKKDFIDKYHLFFDENLPICEDIKFNAETLAKCQKVAYLNRINYFYWIGNMKSGVHAFYPDFLNICIGIEKEKDILYANYRKLDSFEEAYTFNRINKFYDLIIMDFGNYGNEDGINKRVKRMKAAFYSDVFFPFFRKWNHKISTRIVGKKQKIMLLLIKNRMFFLVSLICQMHIWKKHIIS